MLQDPLYYERLSSFTMSASRISYLAWRLGQGDLGRALRTGLSRAKGTYDEENPADMVEYHVVRKGVDELRIVELIQGDFESVETVRYWSTQSSFAQHIGERLRLENTFGIVARGHR